MKKNETGIDNLINKKCYDDMFSALYSYIEDNPNDLQVERSSNLVETPDGALLTDMEVIKTENCTINENEISFDTLVSCDIEIEETVKRNRETDGVTQWFKLHCTAELSDTLEIFTVCGIEVYLK